MVRTIMDSIDRIAIDAIKMMMMEELSWHNAEGCGDYKMSAGLKQLIGRARTAGLTIEVPYDGYAYLGQAEE